MIRTRTTLLTTTFLSLLAAGAAQAQKPSGDALLTAAQSGLSADAMALLKQGAPVNAAIDATGETALAWAVMHGDLDLTAALLKSRANPNTADTSGVTPLMVAIQNSQPEMVKLLLDKGANAGVARMTGETALMLAVRGGSADIVSALLDHHADVNAREAQFGQTALMWAAGQPQIARLLLDHGADIKPVTKDWTVNAVIYTPVTATVGVTGIPWNNDGTYSAKAGGLNALIFAVQHDDLETTRMLLDAGADVNQASADGTTPLLAALYHWRSPEGRMVDARGRARAALTFVSDYKLANLLMDRGAKAMAVDGAGYTPLHGALLGMAPRPVADRFAAPAKITQKPANPEGVAVVKRLLELGADPNAATVYPTAGPVTQVRVNPTPPGSTPMHIAAQSTDTASLELMIAHGGDVNRLRKDGHTPFSVAAKSNSLPALKVMVAHGANLKMIYNPGDKLADTVEARAEERRNETVLHIAGAAGATDVIEYLVAQGVPTDVVNDHGETALQTADNQEVVRWKLTREGAVGKDGDLNAKRISETTDAFKKAMGIKTKVVSN